LAEAVQSLPRLRGALRLRAPSPALAFAFRSAVAVTAAIWLGKTPGLVGSHSTWILITVLMLLQPTTGASQLKGLLRAVGTVAAAVSAIALFGLFSQDPPLLMAGLFLVQVVAAYGYSGPRFQYAWFVWAFTTAIVLGDAMTGQSAVETVAFERASMVLIGILLVMVVDSLFWPTRAEPQLRASLAARARFLGEALSRAIMALVQPEDAAPDAPASDAGALGSQLALVGAARSELGVKRAAADGLVRLAMLLERVASLSRILAVPFERSIDPDAVNRGIAPALTELARRAQAALDEVAAAVKGSRALVPFSDGLSLALLGVEAERDTLIRKVGWSSALEGRVAELQDLVAVLAAIESTLASADATETGDEPTGRPHFGLDPFRVKIGLRAGVAVIVAFLVPMSLGWPVDATVAPIAFMVAVLTRGAAVQTVTSLAGVLAIGWIAADLMSVFATPHLARAPLALLTPFVVAFGFAYVSVGRPRLAPLPAIGGLVAFLSVFGSTAAPTDVYGPYNTVCYMGVAVGVGWFFSRAMWPASAAGLFRERVAAQLDQCREAVRSARAAEEADRDRHASELARAFGTQLAQLGPLHAQAIHEPVERALDPARRTKILALATDLMDAVLGFRPGLGEPIVQRGGEPLQRLSEALERQDDALVGSIHAVVETMRRKAAHADSGLASSHRVVEECLEELRADPSRVSSLSDEEKRQLLIVLYWRRTLVSRQRAIEDWLSEWREAEAAEA